MTMAIRRLPSLLAVLPAAQLRQPVGELARPAALALSEEHTLLALVDFFLHAAPDDASDDFLPFVARTGGVLGYAAVSDCLRFTCARLAELNRATKTPNALQAKVTHLLALDEQHSLSAADPSQRLLVRNLRTLFGLEEPEQSLQLHVVEQSRSAARLDVHDEDFKTVFEHELGGLRKFLKQVRIRLDHPLLQLQQNPVTVPAHMMLAKVQLIFLGLRVNVVWVQHSTDRRPMYITLKQFLAYKTL